MQAVCDIDESRQNHISRQKSFGQCNAPDGGIVKSPLEPLICVRVGCVGWQTDEVPRQAAHSL
jgi:hypothetical protein